MKSQSHQNQRGFCPGIQGRQDSPQIFKEISFSEEKNTLKHKGILFYRYFKQILKKVSNLIKSTWMSPSRRVWTINHDTFLQRRRELDQLSANKTRDSCKSHLKSSFFWNNKMIKSWRNTSIWKNLTPTGHHKDTSNTIKQEALKKAQQLTKTPTTFSTEKIHVTLGRKTIWQCNVSLICSICLL